MQRRKINNEVVYSTATSHQLGIKQDLSIYECNDGHRTTVRINRSIGYYYYALAKLL